MYRFRLGQYTLSAPFWLAPLAGYTNRAYRTLCQTQNACALAATPMISANGLNYPSSKSKTYQLIDWDEGEQPVIAQVFGHDSATIVKACRQLQDCGAQIIDLNFGCQVRKITQLGAGAALLRNVKLSLSIIEEVVKAVPLPVTVKLRLGWDNCQPSLAIANQAANLGIAALTVHGRTALQAFSGQVNLAAIGQLVSAASPVPVVANGDIGIKLSPSQVLATTKCAALMVGRASLGAPWIFGQLAEQLAQPIQPERFSELPVPPAKAIGTWMTKHVQLQQQYSNLPELNSIMELRGHLLFYLKSLANSEYQGSLADLREALLACQTFTQLLDVLAERI